MPSQTEALNTILGSAGLAPLNSPTTSQSADARSARNLLEESRDRIMGRRWYFNTEVCKVYSPDADGKIQVPANVVDVDARKYALDSQYALRGRFLYDLKNHTDVFSGDVTVDQVVSLAWDSIPRAAQDYIILHAATLFIERYVEDPQKRAEAAQREAAALGVLMTLDSKNAKRNVQNSPAVYPAVDRYAYSPRNHRAW